MQFYLFLAKSAWASPFNTKAKLENMQYQIYIQIGYTSVPVTPKQTNVSIYVVN